MAVAPYTVSVPILLPFGGVPRSPQEMTEIKKTISYIPNDSYGQSIINNIVFFSSFSFILFWLENLCLFSLIVFLISQWNKICLDAIIFHSLQIV